MYLVVWVVLKSLRVVLSDQTSRRARSCSRKVGGSRDRDGSVARSSGATNRVVVEGIMMQQRPMAE